VKDHQELVKNIRRGDTVITSGGLVGKVTKVVDDDQIEFEISDGVRVRQMRQMISGVRTKGEPAKEKGEGKEKAEKDETSAS
jgi:preprotein translocase subunit YajC